MKPLILDLFSGAGGAAKGYQMAGFQVVGVDIKPQPHYPFEFIQADALTFLDGITKFSSYDFDAIHASPPCQAYSAQKTAWNYRKDHPKLIEPTRELLEQTGLPYVIENVRGAPLQNPMQLCGTQFELGANGQNLHRHRMFEAPWLHDLTLMPPCAHKGDAIGIYGDHLRLRSRGHRGPAVELSGAEATRLGGEAMDIDWMDWDELKEAIPPAYTEFIGTQLIQHLKATT